jgi:hypothetical protein
MIPTVVTFLLYALGALVSLLVLYAIIRIAATHALREHSIWVHEGGVAKAIAKRDDA